MFTLIFDEIESSVSGSGEYSRHETDFGKFGDFS